MGFALPPLRVHRVPCSLVDPRNTRPNAMSSTLGNVISESFDFVSQVGGECEALAKLIKQEVGELLLQDLIVGLYEPGEWSSSYRVDGNGWVYTSAAWSLPLTHKVTPAISSHLAFQVSLLCNDAEGGGSAEPLLHVNFWDVKTDVNSENFMGFPMYGLTPATKVRLETDAASLFRWNAENGAPDSWTFSLRLAKINCLEDVRRSIVSPINQLLLDSDAGESALIHIDSVVRYAAVARAPDYYRVVS